MRFARINAQDQGSYGAMRVIKALSAQILDSSTHCEPLTVGGTYYYSWVISVPSQMIPQAEKLHNRHGSGVSPEIATLFGTGPTDRLTFHLYPPNTPQPTI